MKKEITFILPTRNRRDYIIRAIESCLAVEGSLVRPYVLVIDGESDDGAYELMTEKFKDHPQVEIIQNARDTGFQRTAYQGALKVQTEYVSFMYNDDVLSPYFYDLIAAMLKNNKSFVMGYGIIYNVKRVYSFKPIDNIHLVSKYHLAQAYFGFHPGVEHYPLPVSPICCVLTKKHLHEWVHFSQAFADKNKMRYYYMIEKNIGPDIIIYLSSILAEEETVLLASNVVAQFSEHDDSMSIGYGPSLLDVGYWIGRIWAFEKLCKADKPSIAAYAAAHLIIQGYKHIYHMISRFQLKWIPYVCWEILLIKISVIKHALLFSVPGYMVRIVIGKIKTQRELKLPL